MLRVLWLGWLSRLNGLFQDWHYDGTPRLSVTPRLPASGQGPVSSRTDYTFALRHTFALLHAFALLLCVIAPLSAQAASPHTGPITVWTSIKPITLMLKAVGGDRVQVQTLSSGQKDPHAQALALRDRQAIAKADLLVWIGPEFERFLAKIVDPQSPRQLALSRLPNLQLPPGQADYHLWLSPNNLALALDAIAERLIQLRPHEADFFHAQRLAAQNRLAADTARLRHQLAPLAPIPFVVSHDGYRHFVMAFGLNQLAAVSRLPEETLSPTDRITLEQHLKRARCLIVEPDDRRGRKLAAAAKLPAIVLDPLATDPAIDSLSALFASLERGMLSCLAHPLEAPSALQEH